ncbi:MAG: hypothetical protein ORN51_11530 [Akkermansiaceae bacterium]|nr:hypothetical protein [Akkermansiaceae bacterium]
MSRGIKHHTSGNFACEVEMQSPLQDRTKPWMRRGRVSTPAPTPEQLMNVRIFLEAAAQK